jgi:hypothetical protein
VLSLYELSVEAAAAAGEAPLLPLLQTLVAAAAEAAPGSGTHLYWAQQYAAAAAAAQPSSSSSSSNKAAVAAEAEQQRLSAYQLRYGAGLSSELYSKLAALPVDKPVRQLACAAWDWGHDYSPSTGRDLDMDGSRGRGTSAEEAEDVYMSYFGDDGAEGGPSWGGTVFKRRMHVEL